LGKIVFFGEKFSFDPLKWSWKWLDWNRKSHSDWFLWLLRIKSLSVTPQTGLPGNRGEKVNRPDWTTRLTLFVLLSGTRVFAKWSKDKCYYPGMILYQEKNRK
jgi:hypothetical protein